MRGTFSAHQLRKDMAGGHSNEASSSAANRKAPAHRCHSPVGIEVRDDERISAKSLPTLIGERELAALRCTKLATTTRRRAHRGKPYYPLGRSSTQPGRRPPSIGAPCLRRALVGMRRFPCRRSGQPLYLSSRNRPFGITYIPEH